MPVESQNPTVSPPPRCGRGSLVGIAQDGKSIRIIPMMCHKWSCPRCARIKTNYWRRLALSGKPERFITLTYRNDGSKDTLSMAAEMKRAWPRLLVRIRKKYGPFEYLLVWELTEKGAPHIHMLQRGCYIEKNWLSETWAELTGAPIVSIKAIDDPGTAANYVTKYMGKSLARTVHDLPGLRCIQRSQNWVVEDDKPADSPEGNKSSAYTRWFWCREDMSTIIATAVDHLGWLAMPTEGPDCSTLVAPGDPDAIAVLFYDLKHEEN